MTHNRITIVGYLGQDASVKVIQNSDKVLTTWSVATHEKERGKYVTTWHRAIIFDAPDPVKLAKKGMLVLVEGRLAIRTFTDSEGARRMAVEIIAQRAILLASKEPTGDAAAGESESEQGDF